MNRYVILDLETTGVAYDKGDRIIQIAYQVLEDHEVLKRFSTYINYDRPVPAFIQSLTGISEEHLENAPLFEEVAPEILSDLEEAYFVAHNVEFDLKFLNESLEEAGYAAFQGPVIDTVELARICLPSEDSYRLSDLAKTVQATHTSPHQADSDVEATRALFRELYDKISGLPAETLDHLISLSPHFKSDITEILRECRRNTVAFGFDRYRGMAIKSVRTHRKDDVSSRAESIIENATDMIKNEELMKQSIPGFELRSTQQEMMTFVEDVFKHNQIGLVEAGTGTGKTLSYLIPAVIHAVKHDQPVVISTDTIQLQSQMLNKEWAVIEDIFPFPVHASLLKGRGHYLCLQKLENLLAEDTNDHYDRAVAKAQLLIWILETDTGDVEEVNLATTNYRFWMDVSSDGISCTTPKCPWFTRDYYQRAKQQAREADIIVTNHSLLLTDVRLSHQIIPSYDSLILDEAHHLEDTATRQFGYQQDYISVIQLLNALANDEQQSFLSGALYKKLSGTLRDKYQELQLLSETLHERWNQLFIELHGYGTIGKAEKTDTSRKSKVIAMDDHTWKPVQEAILETDGAFRHLISMFRKLLFEIENEADEQGYLIKLERDIENLSTASQAFEDEYETFYHLYQSQDEKQVIWLELEEKGPRQSITIRSAPVDVSETLADQLFASKKRVILTSATMTVKSSFDYVIERFGLTDFDLAVKHLPSPFEYEKQVGLFVPEDMPLIQGTSDRAYAEACAYHIFRLSEATEGRMLVLFTSYDMLRKTYYAVRDMLDDTYMLIAQGVQTASRQKLIKHFQQFDRSILFGTSSFWEGVDIPGDNLSAIVMVRLPFSPPNDPVFQARSEAVKEQGKNAFMHLALPQAVLRFKQGFGRLIRSSTDRGAVIVLDRRIVTTRYGHLFAKSLQGVPVQRMSMDEIIKEIPSWLNSVSSVKEE